MDGILSDQGKVSPEIDFKAPVDDSFIQEIKCLHIDRNLNFYDTK